MSANNKTFQPVSHFTIKAGSDLLPNRFIGFDGSYPVAEGKSLGVSDSKWLEGEQASVITIGTAIVEITEAINAGELVTADTDGKAKKVTVTAATNGRALDTTTGAGFIRILLIG
ncbi:MAG: DUF2190 family protein [Candidatus Kapabacteria bacterium]|nr:DUF2190 family protein [Candidatus Kapabacteria bacterium]